jgi:uncharacterized membrane protein
MAVGTFVSWLSVFLVSTGVMAAFTSVLFAAYEDGENKNSSIIVQIDVFKNFLFIS